jgi:hypothetical protein
VTDGCYNLNEYENSGWGFTGTERSDSTNCFGDNNNLKDIMLVIEDKNTYSLANKVDVNGLKTNV